jgi:AraC family transcriptional regulator, positive regulator of tynA and feaB
MLQRDGAHGTPLLNFEAWRALLRTICGRYSPEGIEPDAFLGWVRTLNVCGLAGVDIGWNVRRVERTYEDVRLDGADHYYTVFQVAGRSILTQNDQVVPLAVGDVALVDSARPVTYVNENGCGHWFSLELPRQLLVSHLAARLLHRRALLGTGQPLREIAYACGFRDYAHFARKFRHRFGYPPGAHQT